MLDVLDVIELAVFDNDREMLFIVGISGMVGIEGTGTDPTVKNATMPYNEYIMIIAIMINGA